MIYDGRNEPAGRSGGAKLRNEMEQFERSEANEFESNETLGPVFIGPLDEKEGRSGGPKLRNEMEQFEPCLSSNWNRVRMRRGLLGGKKRRRKRYARGTQTAVRPYTFNGIKDTVKVIRVLDGDT